MFKTLLITLAIILSGCGSDTIDPKNSTSAKTNTSQSLNKAERKIMNFIDATKQVRLYTPSKEGSAFQGLIIYFDTCQSDESGGKRNNCDYSTIISKKFEHCQDDKVDGDCNTDGVAYKSSLGFLKDSIHIAGIAYSVILPTYYAMILTDEAKKCSSLLMYDPHSETVDAGEAKDYEDLKPQLTYPDLCDFGLTS